MTISLDSDLSEQLKDCKPGEKITLQGTVTSNQDGTVEATIDTGTSDQYEEASEPAAGESADMAGMMGGGPQSIPGPVRTLLKRR